MRVSTISVYHHSMRVFSHHFLSSLYRHEWWQQFFQKSPDYWLPALATVVILQLRLHYIPEGFYLDRDDGVITLSSARNLVDFGFLGVSPSGERVEAFSAPLEAAFFALTYFFTGAEYHTYILWQSLVASFALGLALVFFFRSLDFDPTTCAAGVLLTSALVTSSGTFMVWHHSGMENCLTHAGLALLLGIAVHIYRVRSASLWLALPLVLISYSRVDLVYECAPVLFLACFFSASRFKERRYLVLFALFLFGWCSILLFRYSLTGSWLPNTAQAQGISVVDNLRAIFQEGGVQRAVPLLLHMLRDNIAILLCSMLFLLPVMHWRRERAFAGLLLLTLGLLALGRAFLFGPSRLDPGRTVTYLTLIVSLLVSVGVIGMRGWVLLRASFAGVLFITPIAALYESPARQMCCAAAEFEEYRCALSEIAAREGIPRPLVANPDLGAMSFHKTFNIFDLGYLANPVLSQLRDEESVAKYFFSVIAPDLIEVSPYWRERTRKIFDSALVETQYQRVTQWSGSCNVPEGIDFYVRRSITKGSTSRERAFIDELYSDRTVSRIEREIQQCLKTEPEDCFYIVRSVYRFLPELRREGKLDAVLAVFSERVPKSNFLKWGRAHLSSDRSSGWITEAQIVVDGMATSP
jgi:hypothetical protein